MVNDSTIFSLEFDVKDNKHFPRQSSIVFLRQFARVYMGSTACGSNTFSLN